MQLSILPAHIGLPQFAHYRPNQQDAICRGLASPKQFVFLDMPTGDGKSLTYYTIQRLNGLRTGNLTSTKALEDQLMRDFAPAGLVNIHGRNNYRCVLGGGISCEDGADIKCTENRESADTTQCPYRRALTTAKARESFVSNYVYHALVHKHTEGLGHISQLMCDEGHELPEIITGINEIYLSSRDSFRLRMKWPDNPGMATNWVPWGLQALPVAESLLAESKQFAGSSATALKELGHLRSLCSNLAKLAAMKGWWIAEPVTSARSDGWRLEPVWAAEHAESTIWRGIPKVFITTATMSTALPAVLGITPDRYEFLSYPSSFEAYRSPFIYIPTAKVFEGWKASAADIWMRRIDEIIAGRLDRKGIIHCTSYKRRQFIQANSRFRHLMIDHESGSESAMEAIALFKALPAPAIMITPAMTTGYDFPYSTCRYQILTNVPYPNTASQVMKARTGQLHEPHTEERRRGELYQQQYIATQIAQAAGRGMRAPDDWCENFMIDDKFKYAYFSHQGVYPTWFRLLVKTSATVPPALNLNQGPY